LGDRKELIVKDFSYMFCNSSFFAFVGSFFSFLALLYFTIQCYDVFGSHTWSNAADLANLDGF